MFLRGGKQRLSAGRSCSSCVGFWVVHWFPTFLRVTVSAGNQCDQICALKIILIIRGRKLSGEESTRSRKSLSVTQRRLSLAGGEAGRVGCSGGLDGPRWPLRGEDQGLSPDSGTAAVVSDLALGTSSSPGFPPVASPRVLFLFLPPGIAVSA